MYWISEVLKIVTPTIAVIVSAILLSRKIRQELKGNIERQKYEAILHAHKQMYRLLVYMTDQDNPKNLLKWEVPKGQKDKIHYINRANAQAFLRELPELFYGEGCGLFLSKEIADKFFEYRSIVYKLLLAEQNSTEAEFRLKNEEAATRMKELHQMLSQSIRQCLKIEQRDLKAL
ncbi:CRISPR-associated protein Csx28 [Riemerella anatipestifer]|uniref:type VI-B CRISPR accessory protein Csx28 n=1 Tax=Riemerella anatipestifer TaxID=34085 RepID=UPI002854B376|nr:CRISPR-associated protein Csx28 [Riemerella anatipestifer]MDR7808272.1 CRISPR-associated protein Csx28 [Riemerella anatipestifer]MDR7810164.1 CRISPR-associated protein Csx28 [Riemerella anatipestifer]MDR7816990.1 CRISPR-associated protein Csx28 [Riemerella anatipestifer]MDR7822822.1 CRISPR-associated protein Csx28 [Riemerella anatipestifer]MDR7824718.1 CRISPR-associated protein Csx28 [Riemerella anatipestifer]